MGEITTIGPDLAKQVFHVHGAEVAAAHKAELRRRLGGISRAMGLPDPAGFALKMAIIIDGAPSSGRSLHDGGPARFLQCSRTRFALRDTAIEGGFNGWSQQTPGRGV